MEPKDSFTGRLITRFLNLFVQHQELQIRLVVASTRLATLQRSNASLLTALHGTRDIIDTLEAQITSISTLNKNLLNER